MKTEQAGRARITADAVVTTFIILVTTACILIIASLTGGVLSHESDVDPVSHHLHPREPQVEGGFTGPPSGFTGPPSGFTGPPSWVTAGWGSSTSTSGTASASSASDSAATSSTNVQSVPSSSTGTTGSTAGSTPATSTSAASTSTSAASTSSTNAASTPTSISTAPDESISTSKGAHLTSGAIAGLAIGILAVSLLGCWCLYRRRWTLRRSRPPADREAPDGHVEPFMAESSPHSHTGLSTPPAVAEALPASTLISSFTTNSRASGPSASSGPEDLLDEKGLHRELGVPLPPPESLGSLTPAQRAALRTRLAAKIRERDALRDRQMANGGAVPTVAAAGQVADGSPRNLEQGAGEVGEADMPPDWRDVQIERQDEQIGDLSREVGLLQAALAQYQNDPNGVLEELPEYDSLTSASSS